MVRFDNEPKVSYEIFGIYSFLYKYIFFKNYILIIIKYTIYIIIYYYF